MLNIWNNKLIFINILFYILFILFGLVPILFEYVFDTETIKNNLLWSLFLFPVIIFAYNAYSLNFKHFYVRFLLGLGLGLLFVIVGYILLFLFAQIRIWLGLGI